MTQALPKLDVITGSGLLEFIREDINLSPKKFDKAFMISKQFFEIAIAVVTS